MRTVFAGIDVGSSATKVVLINADNELQGSAAVPTGLYFAEAARTALQSALNTCDRTMTDVAATVSCGYGRRNVDFADGVRTEIACLAKGIHLFFAEEVLVLDIGGRDIKTVHVDASGKQGDFKMNAQCAAGTGAFLEDIAFRMHIPLEQLNALGESAAAPVPVGSHCTVFAAGEVLTAARSGAPVENIVLGIYHSMVKRVIEMISTEKPIVLSGGVAAHHPIVCRLLAEVLGRKVGIPPFPQFTSAFGAAVFAKRITMNNQE